MYICIYVYIYIQRFIYKIYWFQLILFKLVSLLFPTSDFRHPVITPCLVFMSQILLRSNPKGSRIDIAKGLFICTLILEVSITNLSIILRYKRMYVQHFNYFGSFSIQY